MLANLLLLPDDGTYEMLKHVGDLLTSDVYTYFGTYKGWLYKLITVFHVTSSTRAHIKQQKDTTLYLKCLLDVTIQYTYWFIASSKYLLSTTPSCLCNCIFPLGLKLSILLILLISAVIQRLQQQLFSHTKQVPIIYSLLNSLL